VLGTEPQNILTVGMYFAIFPVSAVGVKTWPIQPIGNLDSKISVTRQSVFIEISGRISEAV
jgi:hypothetical protein